MVSFSTGTSATFKDAVLESCCGGVAVDFKAGNNSNCTGAFAMVISVSLVGTGGGGGGAGGTISAGLSNTGCAGGAATLPYNLSKLPLSCLLARLYFFI